MITNLHNIKRVPGLHLPGGRQRKQLANAFHKGLGERFAVYGGGTGWKGRPYARGPIPFHEQGDKIRSAWMSVSWDQFPALPMYSSDRLSISLASGVPHLTNAAPARSAGSARKVADCPAKRASCRLPPAACLLPPASCSLPSNRSLIAPGTGTFASGGPPRNGAAFPARAGHTCPNALCLGDFALSCCGFSRQAVSVGCPRRRQDNRV